MRWTSLGFLSLAVALLLCPAAPLALDDGHPFDLDTIIERACDLDIALGTRAVGNLQLIGRPVVGAEVTIDAVAIKLRQPQSDCDVLFFPLTSFAWQDLGPADRPFGSSATLQVSGREARLTIDQPGAYTVRFIPCSEGCAANTEAVPPLPALAFTFEASDRLPPETIPALPASAREERSPVPFTQADLDRKCSTKAQLVTVEPWAGPQSYADFDADTGEVGALEGEVEKADVAVRDNWTNHVSHDTRTFVVPDPTDRRFLFHHEDPAKNRRRVEAEWETDFFPEPLRPSNGDRVSLFGFWVHDCDHDPFPTEIHPPVGMATHRQRAIPIPADRVFPELGATVGAGVYVPGILTEVFFSRLSGDMLISTLDDAHWGTQLQQPEDPFRVRYECPDGTVQSTLRCSSGIGVPFTSMQCASSDVCRDYISKPAPLERTFTFNVYLPQNPKAVVEAAGGSVPDVPLYYDVLDWDPILGEVDPTTGLPARIRIERRDEDVTYLRVSVDLENLEDLPASPNSRFGPVRFKMAAAWVYPAPDNWGLRRWRVRFKSVDVEHDGDDFSGKGEWYLWVNVNNDQATSPLPVHFDDPGPEWRTYFSGTSVGEERVERLLETGSPSFPDVLLFSDDVFPDQKIHVLATGYEDDEWRHESLSLIADRRDQVAAAYSQLNICSGPHACAHYFLNYDVVALDPPPLPALSDAGRALFDAYDLGGAECPVPDDFDDVCLPVARNLPPQPPRFVWHPDDQPLGAGTPLLGSDVFLYRYQTVEEGMWDYRPSEHIYAEVLAMRDEDPARFVAAMEELRREIDAALARLGPEALFNVNMLRAALPRDAFQRFFGDLPPPESAPDASPRWMTGAGSVRGPLDRVSFQIQLHCNPAALPNTIRVSWREGGLARDFSLDVVEATGCEKPPEPMRKHRGRGIGRLDGVPGATAEWAFEDAGEAGRRDRLRLQVKRQDGQLVLDLDSALERGNLQAHER